MLTAVDTASTVNIEQNFQARSAKAYEVEWLVGPSHASTLDPKDQPRTVALPASL